MTTVPDRFAGEVRSGQRFAFGTNWRRFFRTLTVRRIKLAEASLKSVLSVERLDGQSFLDVGSGSGLFSLAARRLGARVHSFDYDPESCRCTEELKRRYFPEDAAWTIERGSALDTAYLARLGTFDVVYAWGVLHHTGAMDAALENIKPLVPVGGRLVIAIYNDLGGITDEWARIKRRYNGLPRGARLLYALRIIAREEARALRGHARRGEVGKWLLDWTEYDKQSTRGMSRWHDWIDWIGGYPYERATVEGIADVFARDGFRLDHLLSRATGYGCNEFCFHRIAEAGFFVDAPLPGGLSVARRFGARLLPPFERHDGGVYARPRSIAEPAIGISLQLMRDDELLGRAEIVDGAVRLADAAIPDDALAKHRHALVAAEERPLAGPFEHVRGMMWRYGIADLAGVADGLNAPERSSAFLFEDGRQLPHPHALHDRIAGEGGGHFSHWEASLYFAASDGSDPNRNGRRYSLLVAGRTLPADRSFARRHGVRLAGPFRLRAEGWMARLAPAAAERSVGKLFLIRDDRLVGRGAVVNGEILVAPADTPKSRVETCEFFAVAAVAIDLDPPFAAQCEGIWLAQLPRYCHLGDDETGGNAPIGLFEDGRQLPHPHSSHEAIATLGGGRFSYWDGSIWFSTSDDSDPNGNGRRYTVLVGRQEAGPAAAVDRQSSSSRSA